MYGYTEEFEEKQLGGLVQNGGEVEASLLLLLLLLDIVLL